MKRSFLSNTPFKFSGRIRHVQIPASSRIVSSVFSDWKRNKANPRFDSTQNSTSSSSGRFFSVNTKMSKSDVEMEDAEKLHNDSGNNVQESECKATDPKAEREEEGPCVASASGDLNGGENEGEDVNKSIDEEVKDMNKSIDEVEEMNKSIDEVKDKIEVKTVAEDQTKPVNEASDTIKESDCGITITESDNKEPINTETPAEAQTAATSAVENLCDVKKEVVEHDDPDSGVKEDEPTKNDVVNENHGKDVEERPNEDVVEKPEEIAKDTCNTQYVASESMVENAGNVSSENGLLPTKVYATKDPQWNASSENTLPPTEISATKDPQGNASSENTLPPTEISDTRDSQGNASSENTLLPTEISATKDPQGNASSENSLLPTEISATKDPLEQEAKLGNVRPSEDEEMEDAVHFDNKQGAKSFPMSHETDGDEKTFETAAKPEAEESSLANQHEPVTPFALVKCSSEKDADHSGETVKSVHTLATQPFMGEDDDGTPEDQAAFMKALEHFYREKAMDFKPPKFYGHPLNCLKLWRAVIRLGGYDRVTGSKLWRQVGESFHPPKTCTTVSWTFRIFYEKSLLEFERHKTHSGELQLPIVMLPEVSGADVEGNGFQGSGSGPGRARRDSATRAMQGWHAQRVGAGEAGDPIIKEKNLNSMAKNEKNLKSISSLKQKRPNEVEQSNKAARTDISKQLVASVVDVGPPADWVKINVRQTKDCFEVYALVPGLLREEVRVQSDPAGRLVITGQPEQVDNPWGITPFKKIINLPARIHPVQTSAVVSLHGRLYVRVPFEQPNV